jgi:hypothetical protein
MGFADWQTRDIIASWLVGMVLPGVRVDDGGHSTAGVKPATGEGRA